VVQWQSLGTINPKLRVRGDAGFTLVEVLVAAVILLVGIQAATLGFGLAADQQILASHRRDANVVADRLVDKLKLRASSELDGANACDNNSAPVSLLEDRGSDLHCDGAQCAPDYPESGVAGFAELRTALLGYQNTTVGGNSGAIGGTGQQLRFGVFTDSTDGHLARYNGREFRVVWNIQCDLIAINAGAPFLGQRRVRVMVLWPPYDTALSRGRFVRREILVGVDS